MHNKRLIYQNAYKYSWYSKNMKKLMIEICTIVAASSLIDCNNSVTTKVDKQLSDRQFYQEGITPLTEASINVYDEQKLIIERNNRLLKKQGKTVDVAVYMVKAQEMYNKGVSENSCSAFNKAFQYLDEAILKQQENLLE